MDKYIADDLRKIIETEFNIEIIYLCGVGSRAFGPASDTSDYDIGGIFVYHHKPIHKFYTGPNGEVLDVSLWSLEKFKKHVYESNPTAYEWRVTPKRYFMHNDYLIHFVPKHMFDKVRLKHHFMSLIDNHIKSIGKKPLVKRYIYILRAVAAIHCLNQGEYPVMDFNYLPDTLKSYLALFIDMKKNGQLEYCIDEEFIEKIKSVL